MNANVGAENSNSERAIGKRGVMNNNNCLNNNCVIWGTIFAHRDIHDQETTNKWDTIKKTYVEVATKVLGHKKNSHDEWLTLGIRKKIEERKQLKILSTKSPMLQQQVKEAYKDKDVKKPL